MFLLSEWEHLCSFLSAFFLSKWQQFCDHWKKVWAPFPFWCKCWALQVCAVSIILVFWLICPISGTAIPLCCEPMNPILVNKHHIQCSSPTVNLQRLFSSVFPLFGLIFHRTFPREEGYRWWDWEDLHVIFSCGFFRIGVALVGPGQSLEITSPTKSWKRPNFHRIALIWLG